MLRVVRILLNILLLLLLLSLLLFLLLRITETPVFINDAKHHENNGNLYNNCSMNKYEEFPIRNSSLISKVESLQNMRKSFTYQLR